MIGLPMVYDFHRIRYGFPCGAQLVGFGMFVALFLAPRLAGNFVMAQELVTVVDFSSPDKNPRWRIVNDGVMGGLSQSRMNLTSEETGVFEGIVSLENNGGFAPVRTEPTDLGLGAYRGLELRIKGDGKLYQLRLRTDRSWDGIAYRATFETSAGEWTTVRFDFRDFVPSFRGRVVPSAPALEAGRIRQLGILISDKQEGRFRLEIDSIKAYR